MKNISTYIFCCLFVSTILPHSFAYAGQNEERIFYCSFVVQGKKEQQVPEKKEQDFRVESIEIVRMERKHKDEFLKTNKGKLMSMNCRGDSGSRDYDTFFN